MNGDTAFAADPPCEVSAADYLLYQRALLDRVGVLAEPHLPESCHLVVRGQRTHYLDWGGDGPPVLLLHGRAQTAHSWDLICLALRTEYRCIAIDQRGHGLSEWSPEMDYRPSTVARDIADIADKLDLSEFDLVGFSMGGSNALAFTIRNPRRVSRLVLVEAVLGAADAKGVARLREFLTGEDEFASFDDLVERARSFNGGRGSDLQRFALRWNVVQLPNGKWTWRYDRRHRARDDIWRVMLADRKQYVSQLHTIECPTLFVRGGESDLVTAEAAAEFVAQLGGPVESVEIPRMGHSIFGADPTATVDAVSRFLFAERLVT